MDKFFVNITQTAFDDLTDIANYIKDSLYNPTASDNQIARIKKGVFSLSASPYRYPFVRDRILAALGYRSMPVDNYIIFYTVSQNNNTVDIMRILYFRRNWGDLL